MNCNNCGKPLNESQYDATGAYKSCPRCSVADGSEHIFYPMGEFGTTDARSSSVHPEGPQSYCSPCRGDGTGPYPGAIKCSDMP